jgi:hypothetical protein
MKVVALAKGYDGYASRMREAGEEFDLPDDAPKGKWFKPVGEVKAAVKDEPVKAPKQQRYKPTTEALADAGDDPANVDVM